MNAQELDKYIEEHFIKNEELINEAAAQICMTIEQFKENLREFAKAFLIIDNYRDFWNEIIDHRSDLERVIKDSSKRRLLYKLNLDRPKIKNQVNNRKPRQLIKKIIWK